MRWGVRVLLLLILVVHVSDVNRSFVKDGGKIPVLHDDSSNTWDEREVF